MVTTISKTIVRNSSLGYRVKTLGDWVKTSAGSKWNMGSISVGSEGIRISVTQIGSIGLRFGFSGPLSIVVTTMSKTIVWNSSLGYWVKSLGDWVKTSAGSKRNVGSISIDSMGIRISITQISSISLRFSISRSLSIVVTSITKTIMRDSSLGHRVKTSAGSKRNMSSITVSTKGIRISITKIGSISLRFSISRSLSIMVTSITKTIMRNSSLGHSVKTLRDWVKTSARSKRNMSSITVSSEGIRISITKIGSIGLRLGICGSLSIMVTTISQTIVRNSSLGYRVKTLGDWVKTSAGSKRHMGSISINSMGIRISITQIGSICFSIS